MQFTSLKLAGFKSFVDSSEFRIETGVTGIVGPNGCGKSNLLEALRWVMGANSAKAMRAGAMDDVIFSGTNARPARNHASVVLVIDNSDRTAPAQFNDADVLEISRRINRGAGSSYHINGKSCRAKDVQLLFADASTGANSPALVRQGQINELIAAKPQNRRRVLEEAAGISGLHTRRHEAELRLRAAETNLSRLDDIGEELQIQHQQLKKQVRTASRYRNLAAEIRALESFSYLLRWTEAKAAVLAAQKELDELQQTSGDLAGVASRALVAMEAASVGIDGLREEQSIASALVARLASARESVERDEREIKSRQLALERRLQEIERDLQHEHETESDASSSLLRLQAELDELSALDETDAFAASLELQEQAKSAEIARDEAEVNFEKLMTSHAEQQAALANAQGNLNSIRDKKLRFERELKDAKAEMQGLEPDLQNLAELHAAEQEQLETAQQATEFRSKLSVSEQKLQKSEEAMSEARQSFDQVRRVFDQLQAEQAGLEKAVATAYQGDWLPLSEEIEVKAGFEQALAAALGDDLQISLDPSAPAHWQEGASTDQPLPVGVQSLAQMVQAPKSLNARLSQVGVVEVAQGVELFGQLLPGQRLVSKQGHLWRWDGLLINSEAPSSAALRLEQKNRLQALGPQIAAAEQDRQQKREQWLAAKEFRQTCFQQLKDDRQQMPTFRQLADKAQQHVDALRQMDFRREARAEALSQKLEHWQSELKLANQELMLGEQAAADVNALHDGNLKEQLTDAGIVRDKARQTAADTAASLRAVEREFEDRAQRKAVLLREIENWRSRKANSDDRIKALVLRKTETEELLETARLAPEEIELRRQKIFDECEAAEERSRKASDALSVADSNLREAREATRMADSAAASAREAKAGLLARLESAVERLQEITQTITEAMGVDPEELDTSQDGLRKVPNDVVEADSRLHKLRLERDNIDGVNLQAEEQAEELSARLQSMSNDREDLTVAISKLRKGVDVLNEEGRARLLAAFDTINSHFKSLFLTLFGGGEAELRLTESDDPLEAGLDIFACPPGKKMENMNLMSGGEQALTAMALIFAVFLSNPAPVCVLDEVDAPLDDANVDRFCTMLDEMRNRTQTRFIVITHNPLTMSRVDRLYGVTMAERGVSQLVSVDLQRAEDMIAAE